MAKLVSFTFRPEKFVNAVVYLALECPSMSKLKVCKLLFFADKEHLRRYGRPIIGDHYYKLPYGPVPTRGLDILRGNADAAHVALLEKYVSVVGNNVYPKRNPEMKVFSKSDIEILDEICSRFGHMSARDLTDLSHKEPSWVKAEKSGPMDYELFFEDSPQSQAIRDLVKSEQETRDLFSKFRGQR